MIAYLCVLVCKTADEGASVMGRYSQTHDIIAGTLKQSLLYLWWVHPITRANATKHSRQQQKNIKSPEINAFTSIWNQNFKIVWSQSWTKCSYSHNQKMKHISNSHRFAKILIWALNVFKILEIEFIGEDLVFQERLTQCKSKFSTQNSEN